MKYIVIYTFIIAVGLLIFERVLRKGSKKNDGD